MSEYYYYTLEGLAERLNFEAEPLEATVLDEGRTVEFAVPADEAPDVTVETVYRNLPDDEKGDGAFDRRVELLLRAADERLSVPFVRWYHDGTGESEIEPEQFRDLLEVTEGYVCLKSVDTEHARWGYYGYVDGQLVFELDKDNAERYEGEEALGNLHHDAIVSRVELEPVVRAETPFATGELGVDRGERFDDEADDFEALLADLQDLLEQWDGPPETKPVTLGACRDELREVLADYA